MNRTRTKETAACLFSALTFAVTLGLIPALPPSALANELWIPPADKGLEDRMGNWAVAELKEGNKGDQGKDKDKDKDKDKGKDKDKDYESGKYENGTHFGFHVPDNMATFQRAVVVVIPEKAATLTYTLAISLAKNGEHHETYTYTHSDLSLRIMNVLVSRFPHTCMEPLPLSRAKEKPCRGTSSSWCNRVQYCPASLTLK